MNRKLVEKIVAISLAAGLLSGALVYYNFIDKAPESGVEVGNRCPDFTAQVFSTQGEQFTLAGEEFTLSEQIGKVCVVNFWETWCQACVEELPEFNEIQEEYEGKVEVIAMAGVTSTPEYATTWLNDKGWKAYDAQSEWSKFSLSFGYLPAEKTTELGCSGMLPRTIIVGKSGNVAHEQDGSMSYEKLKEVIDELL